MTDEHWERIVSWPTCSSADGRGGPLVAGRPSADRRHVPIGGRQIPCSLALVAALCACGSSRAPEQSIATDGGAVYGLDARPSNATCLAPSRPSAAIDLRRALGSRSFTWPVLVLQAPADASRFFVVQKGGIVSAVSPDGADASDFIDITSQTNSGYDETGLLGMAFHPRWQTNHQAFLFYSAHDGSKLDLPSLLPPLPSTARGKTLDKSTEQVLFTLQKTPADNHNGGMIGFGPDGYLYIALGDGGGAGDILNHAQDTNQLFRQILRLDVDHGSPHSNPPPKPPAHRTRGGPPTLPPGPP